MAEEVSFMKTYPKGVQLSAATIDFMEDKRKTRAAITFDDITLEDKPSDFHPNDVKLHSFVTRKVSLKACGLLSAAMDTVTEAEMALALAKVGGIGVLHRNLEASTQAAMVQWVRKKIHYGGMIDKPITFAPEDRISKVQTEVKVKGWTFTSFPIVDSQNKLLGLLTRDEMNFVEGSNPMIKDIMKLRSQIITAPEGTDSEVAYKIMKENKVKKLPVVKADDALLGMYVWNDVRKDKTKKDMFSLDEEGNFLVAAAIGLGPEDMPRVDLLVESKCKVLVLDSSHGACKPAKDQIARIKSKYGNKVEIIAGNIASYASAMYLLDAEHRPDGLKVGIGPGSICTTRSVTGHGIPQVTAIYEVWRAIQEYGAKTGFYVPIIADGGIRNSGDIVKCFSVGASGIMLGSIFAGTEESPGQIVVDNGKRFKSIRGMGSRSALEERSGSRVRYYRQQQDKHATEELTNEQKNKMVPEGVEGLVEFRGPVEKVVFELMGGIQSGLAHSGSPTIPEFQSKATFWMQGSAGTTEGNPHNIYNIRH